MNIILQAIQSIGDATLWLVEKIYRLITKVKA